MTVEFIPMVDLKSHYAPYKQAMLEDMSAILDSAGFILGAHGKALEEEIAAFVNVPAAVACASGTDALMLALRAMDVGPGDEVIVPTFTFIATAEAVLYVGATPVFADVLPDTFNLDPTSVEEKITAKTKAIVPVHLFGQAADMDALGKLAEEHGLAVLEDCAQSIGAKWRGKNTGAFGRFATLSFFPSKNLGGAGDGGMVLYQSAEDAERLCALRNHGSKTRYYHDELGYNSRLDEIQACILRILLADLAQANAQRRDRADAYRNALADTGVVLPVVRAEAHHVYHQFTIKSTRRDELQKALHEARIASAIYYPRPCHQQAMFAQLPQAHCPVADKVAGEVLSLPMFPELSDAQIARIAGVIGETLAG